MKHYETIATDKSVNIFKFSPIISFKRNHNLDNHLVRVSHPELPKCYDAVSETNSSAAHIKGPKCPFNITETACISK